MKEITIVAISDIKLKKTLNSLEKCSIMMEPAETIIFTSKLIKINNSQKKYIKKIPIKPIKSIEDYSKFIIYHLHKYIRTSHILIVQWDGLISNINKWSPLFLQYDYIGAPFIPRARDTNYSRDNYGDFYAIGNGGFSLRSKRLLESATKYNLKDVKNMTNFHEDGFFCVLHRKFLESKGIKWAPFEVARSFSIESPLSLKELEDLPFGFHGKKMLILSKIIIFLKSFFSLFSFNKFFIKK